VKKARVAKEAAGSDMSPTPEASERQRKAAFKAWETIRRKQAQKQAEAGAVIEKASKAASEILETKEAREAQVSLERDLQAALRDNIEQLESGLVIIDGGKEKISASGRNRHPGDGRQQKECRD